MPVKFFKQNSLNSAAFTTTGNVHFGRESRHPDQKSVDITGNGAFLAASSHWWALVYVLTQEYFNLRFGR